MKSSSLASQTLGQPIFLLRLAQVPQPLLCRTSSVAVNASITFENSTTVQNNLGGLGSVLGPVNADAPFLRFDNVGYAEEHCRKPHPA